MMSVIDELSECIRGIIPYCVVVVMLPVLIVISPVDPVKAAQQFSAYRLHQYDLQGARIGSRSSAFSLEAGTGSGAGRQQAGGGGGGSSNNRKCVLMRLAEATGSAVRLAVTQGAAAIVVLLPERREWASGPTQRLIQALERDLVMEEYAVPVYFVMETSEVAEIYGNVDAMMRAGHSGSALHAVMRSVASNGYQLYTSGTPGGGAHQYQQQQPAQMGNIFGKLAGHGIEEQLPTVLIVAHYDSISMVPSLSRGFESNGSGVVALLQLIRVLSRLYSVHRTQPRYNVAFLLAGGGKLNYIGTKKWLDELPEIHDGSLSPDRIALVLCLERLVDTGLIEGESGEPDTVSMEERERRLGSLIAHVSRVPRDNSLSQRLVAALDLAARVSHGGSTRAQHRRINLSEQQLRWHHERFSLRKLPALTLSSSDGSGTSTMSLADTILDQFDDGDERTVNRSKTAMEILVRNTRVIADGLARVLYNLDQPDQSPPLATDSDTETSTTTSGEGAGDIGLAGTPQGGTPGEDEPPLHGHGHEHGHGEDSAQEELIAGPDWISAEAARADMALLCRYSRSQQLLDYRHPLITSLERLFRRYLHNVRLSRVSADPRDPEFVLYGDTETVVIAHRVKPALFDFLVACGVVCYLGLVFLFIEHFSAVCRVVLRISLVSDSSGSNNNNSKQQAQLHQNKEKLI